MRRGFNRVLSALLIVLSMALTAWIGIIIGQRYERRYSERIIEDLAKKVESERMDANTIISQYEQVQAMIMGDDKLLQTLSMINQHYVDPVKLDTLYEKIVPKVLAELDPHSEYIPAKDFSAVNESLEGEFDGIGISFNALTDTVVVLNVIPQGPSDKAGVRAGDRIMRIDSRNVAGQKIPQDSFLKMLRGPRGSHVKLSIARQGISSLVEVDVERDAIELHSIETAFILDRSANIGFIRLSQFARTSYKEMCDAMRKLEKEGMESRIIDLRGNPGGFLDQVILIANEFLPANKLIVYTEDRYQHRQTEYSRGNGNYEELPLVILVDETSVSSSEILAGAVQDNDRGLIIGRRTFGKGLVQAQIPFDDGSAMRLTVARYYTPTGRSIQKPYRNGDQLGYQLEIVERYNHSEFFTADSILFDESLRYTTPGGRTVYGGGGIMPDIFVPADTTGITNYYTQVWNSNVLYRYTLDFADRHREAMNRVTTLEELDKLFSSTDLIADFVEYAEGRGVVTNHKELEHSKKTILAQIRAYIGRNALADGSGFFYNIYPIDEVVQRAVKELKSQKNK